jgi:hypothetical protein
MQAYRSGWNTAWEARHGCQRLPDILGSALPIYILACGIIQKSQTLYLLYYPPSLIYLILVLFKSNIFLLSYSSLLLKVLSRTIWITV